MSGEEGAKGKGEEENEPQGEGLGELGRGRMNHKGRSWGGWGGDFEGAATPRAL